MYAESKAAREAAAAERQRLDGVKAELDARQRVIAREAEQALSYVKDPKLAAWMDKLAKEPEPDPDSPDYPAYVGRRAAFDTVREFFQHLQTANQTVQQTRQEQEAKAARDAQVAENTKYIEGHLDDFRDPEVYGRIQQLVHKHGFSVPEAHRISMQERAASSASDVAELKRQAQEAARARVRRGGRSDTPATEPPPGLSAVQRDEWYQAHPEAAKARLARYRRSA
jgi:hypothetical protein